MFVSQSEFIEKDNDALHSDLEELIQDSKDTFLKSLFPGVAIKKNDIGSMSFGNAINRVGSKKLGFISVGNKFRVILVTPQFILHFFFLFQRHLISTYICSPVELILCFLSTDTTESTDGKTQQHCKCKMLY